MRQVRPRSVTSAATPQTYTPIQSLGGSYGNGNSDGNGYTFGVQFTVTQACTLTAIGFWNPVVGGSGATRNLALWSTTDASTGTLLCYGSPFAPAASGWNYSSGLVATDGTTPLSSLSLSTGTTYVVGVFHSSGGWVAINGFFTAGSGAGADVNVGPVHLPSSANAIANKQGMFVQTGSLNMPNTTFGDNGYGTDIIVTVP